MILTVKKGEDKMTPAEIIQDLELHVAKYGGEEVTERVNTRDILAALKERK